MLGRSRRWLTALLLVAATLAAGCGADGQELEVSEGEPVELGELLYNVQITRFLNSQDAEDAAYLRGQPPVPRDEEYLAVFMTVRNEGDQAAELPEEMTIRDTQGNTYQPLESESAFALQLGGTVPAGGIVPALGTPAASGPTRGGMILFRVDHAVTENRPIELEIPSENQEHAQVELDI